MEKGRAPRIQSPTTRSTTDTAARVGLIGQLAGSLSIGVLQTGVAISLAALIFSGPISPGLGRAAISFILASVVVAVTVAWRSSMSVVIAGAQDTAAVVAAVVAASVAADIGPDVDTAISTVVTMVALATLLTAIAFAAVSRWGWSSVVRFVPWPVVTGFTAGTGWLLLRGGLEVSAGQSLGIRELAELAAPATMVLAAGAALALMIVAVLRSRVSNTVVSAAILASTVGFHLIGRSLTSLERLEADGWLIGPFPAGTGMSIVTPSDLAAADWGVLAAHALGIVVVVAVSVIGLLLNLSGLGALLDTEIDLDSETRISAGPNVVAAIVGGGGGWPLIGDSLLADKLGLGRRLPALVFAMVGIAVVVLGADTVGLMPRWVAGGVLAGLGLNVLVDWLTNTLARLGRSDRLLSVGILLAIAVLGILPGVALGTMAAAGLFILRYSQIEPATQVLAAAGRSNVDRHPVAAAALDANTNSILAVRLSGYLFFGSIVRLRSAVADLVADPDHAETRFLIIDLAQVSGVDSTAAAQLGAIASMLEGEQITPVMSGVGAAHDELMAVGLDGAEFHRDLDHAIEWCEDEILTGLGTFASDGVSIRSMVVSPELRKWFDVRDLEAGEAVIAAGTEGTELYVVQSGRLSAWVVVNGQRRVRIRQVAEGALLGEVSFARGGLRTADVVADCEARLLVMPRLRYDRLVAEHPEVAVELTDKLLACMADRVAQASTKIRDLGD